MHAEGEQQVAELCEPRQGGTRANRPPGRRLEDGDGPIVGSVRQILARSTGVQAQRQLDLPAPPKEQSFPSAFLSRHLLLSVLRASDVLLRVYQAGDRLVRGILR